MLICGTSMVDGDKKKINEISYIGQSFFFYKFIFSFSQVVIRTMWFVFFFFTKPCKKARVALVSNFVDLTIGHGN